MVFRRRYRRCCYNRAIILLLTLFSTLSTVTFTYNYISNTFVKPWNDDDRVYLVDQSDLDDARIKPNPSYELLPKEFFNTTHLACHYPKLTIDNEEVWKYLQPVTRSRPECEKSTNWVYVENGPLPLESHQIDCRTRSLSRHLSLGVRGPAKARRHCLRLPSDSSLER